jgi:hypothetical protein
VTTTPKKQMPHPLSFAILAAMGLFVSRQCAITTSQDTTEPAEDLREKANLAKPLTAEERSHLVLLGTTAGTPSIMHDAIKSGNIFDPAHMERAQKMNDEWNKGAALLAPFIERQKKIDAELEALHAMGEKMEGKPTMTTYARLQHINYGNPQPDWFLRIETEDAHVDMTLGPREDHVHDAIIDASRYVPRFRARLFCPEPVVVYTHP